MTAGVDGASRSGIVAVEFYDDNDGTGTLSVSAEASGFAGSSAAWFGVADLAAFAHQIQAFPLPDAPAPRITGGFLSREVPGELEQEHVSIVAIRDGALGQVSLRVHLASEIWPTDDPERRLEVRLELLTTYQRLRAFSDDLLDVIRGEAPQARIDGELLSGTRPLA